MHATAALILLQGLLAWGTLHSQVDIDLDAGVVTGYSDRVHLLTFLSTNSEKSRCGTQAVIGMELGGRVQVAHVTLNYNTPRLWTLHISDSLQAEGFGNLGNATTELHVLNQQLRVYNKWPQPQSSAAEGDGSLFVRVVDDTVRKHTQMDLTFTLRSNSFRWQDGRLAQDFHTPPELFYENGSLKNKTILYMSMNRILAGDWRSGSGLCQVAVKLMEDEEECNAREMGCDPNAVCKLTRRGYRCSCKKGWQGNGKTCRDISECVVRDGGCVHKCHNTPGSYRCSCHSGFTMDPQDPHNCLDMNECAIENGKCEQECINTIGSYECKCVKDGITFTTNQKHCRHGNALCTNHECQQTCELGHNMRLKFCSCWPHYQINITDSKSCVRTCHIGNGGCHHHCLDTETGPVCTCQHKYLLGLDGHSCAASCAVNNGGCQKRCTNTDVGVSCSCPNGYTLNEDGKSCSDINECATGQGGCQYKCINNIGSYECICPAGYKLNALDEKTCIDINECELNDTCQHICFNAPGSFRCECHSGYQLYGITHCGDIDECSIGNGGCTQVCINTEGSFHCSSNMGERLQTNFKQCIDAYIASTKFFLTGVLYNQTNNIKAYGQRTVIKVKEIAGIKDCVINFHKFHTVTSKKILHKHGKSEGQMTQIIMDISCKTMNATRSCNQQCSLKKSSQLFCNSLSLLKEALDKPLSLIIDNRSLAVVPHSFSVRQTYTAPCQVKGERTRTENVCEEHRTEIDVSEPEFTELHNGLGSDVNDQITSKEHCKPGSYWKNTSRTCELCMKDTYQENSGQQFCIKCPESSATDGKGSTSVNDCKGTKCHNYINDLSGYIESPNYPGNYPSNADCTWIVKPPKRRRLLIIIPEISLAGEKCEDYLVMRKSKSPYSVVTFEACKSITKPIAFAAQSRTLWLHFQSDGHNNSKGFHIPFVTYNEEYQTLIEDIVQDSRLYASHNHLEILRDKKLLRALMEVIAQPVNYYKYESEQRKMFPSSFIRFMTPKVRKFFSYRR